MEKNKKITLGNFAEFKEYIKELIAVDFADAIFGNDFIIVNGKRIEFRNVKTL